MIRKLQPHWAKFATLVVLLFAAPALAQQPSTDDPEYGELDEGSVHVVRRLPQGSPPEFYRGRSAGPG
jgi:hypothetical protein